jgi:hypothetical protein
MPSIQTLVADLNNGSIPGIGGKPASNATNVESVLSGTCRVKNSFVHVIASLSGAGKLSCQAAATSPNFNAGYVHFEDDWSTVGTLDVNRRLLISGNFSGCLYKIYRSGVGVFKGVHIARPAGVGANALIQLMADYALQNQWVEIQAVPTVGQIPVGGEVMIVSQMFVGDRIDTIRLQINNQGLIVGRTLFSVAI